jgi:peptide/nickel transport system permease protein
LIEFLVRRLIASVVLLVIVSVATFAIFFLVPRIAGQTADQLAAQYVGREPSQEAIDAVKAKLGLEDPIVVQYGRFAKGIVVGAHYDYGPDVTYCPPPCFGYSFKTQQAVFPLLLDRLPVTASLAIGASVLWLLCGVSIGVLSALRRGSFFDRAAMSVALAGVSLPVFFTGLLSLALVVHAWRVLPTVVYVPLTENPFSWARALILPWLTLAFLYAALYARLTRAGMLETMGEDYIRTARAKGLPESTVVVKHGLRAALTPILTIFGLDLGLLLAGAVLTESTFSLPGMGRLAVDAIRNNDLPIVLGVTMFAAIFVIFASLIVDICYAVLDPRVRYQ